MINGLYSSATSMEAMAKRQEAIASNLAHLNTPGHRRMLFKLSERTDGNSQSATPGTRVTDRVADFSQGRMEQTGRKLDVAINGDGFFVYQGANEPIYSRGGVLFRNPDNNQLVNVDGLPILGDGQPIIVDAPTSQIAIGIDGTISVGDQQVGKLSVVQFDDNLKLESENQTYFRVGDAQLEDATDFQLYQGHRELSNASPVTEMINLIIGSRQFEASQRAIRMISDVSQESIRS